MLYLSFVTFLLRPVEGLEAEHSRKKSRKEAGGLKRQTLITCYNGLGLELRIEGGIGSSRKGLAKAPR